MRKFLPIDTIVEDVIDWGDYRGMIDRVAMKKWANSLLRKLEAPNDYIDKIVMLEVKDYKVILPEDMQTVVQVAFRDETPRKIRRMEIVEWTQKMYDGSGCELIISKDCPKCHNIKDEECGPCTCDSPEIIYDVDRLWELSHPEFKYNHMKHYYRHGGLTNENQIVSPYHPEFTLMKKSNHSFFNADSHIPGCLNLNTKLLANCNIEYKINFPILEVNRKEGKILLSYLAVKLDKSGYRMIPDVEDVFEALKWYIIEAMEYRSIGKATTLGDKNHHKQMWSIAKAEKIDAMGRAYEILNTPTFNDWMCFLENNYFKMFKDQNTAEQLGVRTPDMYDNTMGRLTNHM